MTTTKNAERLERIGRVPREQLLWLANHVGFDKDFCLLWPFSVNTNGYGTLTYKGRSAIASRVMCTLAHGDPPHQSLNATHNCNFQRCVNPKHLRWGTATKNTEEVWARKDIVWTAKGGRLSAGS